MNEKMKMSEETLNSKFVDAFSDWLDIHGYSKKTILSYSAMFNHFTDFLNMNEITWDCVTHTLINDFLKKKYIKEKTKGVYVWLFSDFFSYLIETGLAQENPAERILQTKKKNQRGRAARRIPLALSEHETAVFFEHTKSTPTHYTAMRGKCAILLMLGCGLRVQEVCDLKDGNMHLDDEIPYLTVIGKGNRERAVPVPESIIPIIEDFRDMRNDTTGIFLSAKGNGKQYTPCGLYRLVRRSLNASNIVKTRMSPHILRHTFATNQLRNGIGLPTVKLWLGHDYISTTAGYEHVVTARKDEKPVILISNN